MRSCQSLNIKTSQLKHLLLCASLQCCLQTSLEYMEQGKLVNLALASVRYGTPGVDAKAILEKVQKRMLELEAVSGAQKCCTAAQDAYGVSTTIG